MLCADEETIFTSRCIQIVWFFSIYSNTFASFAFRLYLTCYSIAINTCFNSLSTTVVFIIIIFFPHILAHSSLLLKIDVLFLKLCLVFFSFQSTRNPLIVMILTNIQTMCLSNNLWVKFMVDCHNSYASKIVYGCDFRK